MASATAELNQHGAKRDAYRFGTEPLPVLRPGTIGWTAADLDDPAIFQAWLTERYEILDGVLTIMPAAYFRGGECAVNLMFVLKPYLKSCKIPATAATEVNIQTNNRYVLRADVVFVFGEALQQFNESKLMPGGRSWRDRPLMIPPSLVIESVSQGHEAHDRISKRNWYAEFGVKHYWIVDGFARSLECLLLQDGDYIVEAAGKNTEVLTPASLPGLSIPLSEVWGD